MMFILSGLAIISAIYLFFIWALCRAAAEAERRSRYWRED